MSDHDDTDNFKSQALPVGDMNNYDPSVIPASAEEYLKSVVWESQQYTDIVTVPVDSSKVKKVKLVVHKRTKMKAPEGYAPSVEAQKEFLAQFSVLTSRIDRCRTTFNIPKSPIELPDVDDECGWCKFCFGTKFLERVFKKDELKEVEETVTSGNSPLLSIILNIPSVTIENLVEWQAEWLQSQGFSEDQGRWLYSLCACLDKPLTPETCSVLRHILQMCATIRAALESVDDPDLIQLNMIITIISKYFNQNDLSDT